jgi:acyl-CoA thioesterase
MKTEGKNMNLLEKRKEKKVLEKRREERERLRKDIENLEAEMERNEAVFNLTTDEYLLESAIYEHNAQKAKMNYLLKLAKEI